MQLLDQIRLPLLPQAHIRRIIRVPLRLLAPASCPEMISGKGITE